MRVGKLRHIATIENPIQTKDAMGGKKDGWELFSKVYCSLSPIKGTETWYSKEKHSVSTHHVNMRFITGVNPKMRMLIRERTFYIVSSINIGERDKELLLLVEEDTK